MERVFKDNRIDIAIDALGLTRFENQAKKVIGPRDLVREEELRVLDTQIEDGSRYFGVEYNWRKTLFVRRSLLADLAVREVK